MRTPGRKGRASRAEQGYLHCGPNGAGHFVKMVHNGIEYGLMAAYAEGLNIIANADVGLRQREADAADDREAFHQADEAFHATIADVAGYPGIWKFIQQVKIHVDRYRRLTLPVMGRMTEVIAEHEPIMAAIEAHDPEAARIAMDRHLERLLSDISATQNTNPEFFDQSG